MSHLKSTNRKVHIKSISFLYYKMNNCAFATLIYIVLFKSGSTVTGIQDQNSEFKGNNNIVKHIYIHCI